MVPIILATKQRCNFGERKDCSRCFVNNSWPVIHCFNAIIIIIIPLLYFKSTINTINNALQAVLGLKQNGDILSPLNLVFIFRRLFNMLDMKI